MNVRPLFWMMVGAGATLVGGAWGGRQFLPIPSDSQQTVKVKTAALMEVAVKPGSDYAAENSLRRTPWVKPKADPFGEKPVVVPRAVAPVMENREPLPLAFPFEYVGKLTADGKETLFLTKDDQIYPVAEGEILGSIYRVEHIGSDSIELSYLPDARKMTITLETITAKHAPGVVSPQPNGVIGLMVPSPAVFLGGEGVPQPIMTQPPVDQKEMTADLQPVMAPLPPTPSQAEGGQQSAATPVPMPPGMMPPGMMPPEMMPPGATQ